MSAASLASFVIGKLTTPEPRTGDASDMSDRGQPSPTPRLTTVWGPKSIPYDIPNTNQPFKSDGSLLRLLRSKSMPMLGREGTPPPGRQAAPPQSRPPPRSESPSPVRCAAIRGANTQSSGYVSDASESTVASLATPPPTPRSPSPSGQRRTRSHSDGHLWQRRKRQMRKDTQKSAVVLPSVKDLRGKIESNPTPQQGDEQPTGQGQPAGEASEESPKAGIGPDRRWVSRHNSLLLREPRSPERRQPPKPAVTAASVRKRLQEYEDSPQHVDEASEVFMMTDQQDLRGKSRSEASLKTARPEPESGEVMRRTSDHAARMRKKNHRRSKSEPDASSVLRYHAQSSPPSVKKLKMLFEREATQDSGREPPPLSPSRTVLETTPEAPRTQIFIKLSQEEGVVQVGVGATAVPVKTPPMEHPERVLPAWTPSVRSLRQRFEAGASGQSFMSTEKVTITRTSRIVIHTLRTPFERPLPRQARSMSPEKEQRGSLTRMSSASVKNLQMQFEPPLSPVEDAPPLPLTPPPSHAAAKGKVTPKVEKDSRRWLQRQSRTSSSSSSSDDEKDDNKRRQRELEEKRKEEEKAKKKQRLEQEEREKKKKLEQEKAEKERIAKEKERIAKEEKERKEREERERRTREEMEKNEREENKKEEKADRDSDVASLVQKFRKMNARWRSSSSSSSSDCDGGRASPEKPKPTPIPTIPARTTVPDKVRTLRADELRFFGTSGGATEPFMRTQSLRGKKKESSSFAKPRFGSLRGGKSRVPVISTSSSTNAALPKNCRHLYEDELRFFGISGGESGVTVPFMRTVSLRGKKSESSSFAKHPFGSLRGKKSESSSFAKTRFRSLRGGKSRVAVISTSSSTNAALPKNCRNLYEDELRFFGISGAESGATVPFMRTVSLRGKKSESSSRAKPRFGSLRGGKSRVPVISTSSSTNASLPKNCRNLYKDELRFFGISGGESGVTEHYMRTRSLRGKKSESSSFAKPRFGSLRGGKSRVAVISTSSSTNAALPKNCRHLNKDELRFFEGKVTNIYQSRATSDRDGKTTRGEGKPPAVPRDNTLPDSEVFFRLAGRGGPAPKGTGRPAPREDDS
ncbi:uncharacterized protein LOC127003258 [Eriocheir sinensis]|uniref:uncharacterized protein LOC127003258 n=1 Tax=Eriocheir sinensis TaxID=95602 RepID=UPI0021C92ECD|nr:uncharacterized protein LOC127003258 [Eriocheir sinensis]XP_050725637.1 uncharacterized protein LOC127003258 [Eriocheir sinensis]XP_050725639.1 uncharacterized protein LOC127003258 [Eriocheir sinensis]XP_050725640.1 uncharacterized protein LOC127003258 [Eriocheir sinensis]